LRYGNVGRCGNRLVKNVLVILEVPKFRCGSDFLVGRPSIRNFERRTVLGPGFAVIVNAGGRDVGVAEPLLRFGDVGLVIERIGGGRRPQRMSADLEAEARLAGGGIPVAARRANGTPGTMGMIKALEDTLAIARDG
jgi:hypothetical protein